MRRIFALIFLLATISVGSAQRGSGSSGDLFDMGLEPDPATFATINRNTKAVSLRATQTLSPAVKNLVMIAAGQSNMVNITPSAYSPANASALDVFNPYDGAIYAAADPLLGASLIGVGHPALRIADTLVTNGKFDRVVIVPIGVGGASVANYDTGVLATRFPVALRRLAARGLVAGTNVTVIVIWGQGETDGPIGTSQASYTASLNSLIAKSRVLGFTGLWFVAKQTYNSLQVWAAIQAAQAAVVNHPSGVWAGPDADSLVGNVCVGSTACRQADNVHFSDTGSASYAALWVTALGASGAPF